MAKPQDDEIILDQVLLNTYLDPSLAGKLPMPWFVDDCIFTKYRLQQERQQNIICDQYFTEQKENLEGFRRKKRRGPSFSSLMNKVSSRLYNYLS